MKVSETEIAGWGNYPKTTSTVHFPADENDLKTLQNTIDSYIPRGAGKSYGDASLHSTIGSSVKLNRTLNFDSANGILSCEAGKMLSDVLDEIIPHGFFLPVTPGTKLITVGGAIAADIHGKNHHKEGCFSEHLISFSLLTAKDGIVVCSRTENAELFWATCGGMGLTGFIVNASFKLKRIESTKIVKRTIKCNDLKMVVNQLLENENYTYSVAWIDCGSTGKNLGRSLLYLGEHASETDVQKSDLKGYRTSKPIIDLPFNLPSWTLNQLTVKAFNTLYYGKVLKQDSTSMVGLESFFYPLDGIGNWNRLYGKNGFVQYQFIIPMKHADSGLSEIMRLIAASGESSFLAVLKLFGEQNEGWLSFPKRGITLALDFRVNATTFKLLGRLDALILEMDGRSYLAKDARMKADFFAAGYPKLDQFKQLLSQIDPNGKFRSLQSDRLKIT